jgi:hypothetical protein
LRFLQRGSPFIKISEAQDLVETAKLNQGDIEDDKYQLIEEEDIYTLKISKDLVWHITDNNEKIIPDKGYTNIQSHQEEDLEVAKYPEEYELNPGLQYKFTKDNFIRLFYGSDFLTVIAMVLHSLMAKEVTYRLLA